MTQRNSMIILLILFQNRFVFSSLKQVPTINGNLYSKGNLMFINSVPKQNKKAIYGVGLLKHPAEETSALGEKHTAKTKSFLTEIDFISDLKVLAPQY